MSYTNVELIRPYLDFSSPVAENVSAQTFIMRGEAYRLFYGGPVLSGSVKVKVAGSSAPQRVNLVLTSDSMPLPVSEIVSNSVVVASDSSLGYVYQANSDYVVDYDNAILHRRANGAIPSGAALTLWYVPQSLYVSGVDFTLDEARGAIRRLPSGNILDWETVLLDYTPLYAAFSDSLLTTAVELANTETAAAVDPRKQFGANPNLQTVATYRALEIVCQAAASRELSRQGGEDRVASVWLKLSDYYHERSEQLMRKFVPPFPNPASPAIG